MSSLYDRFGAVSADISDNQREFWHLSGSMDEHGEFKQYLHIFVLRRDADGGGSHSVYEWESFPWIAVWPKPDIEELAAYWQMTKWELFPHAWESLWFRLEKLRALSQTSNKQGPYWMLLSKPQFAQCANAMVRIKRRLSNELGRDIPHRDIRPHHFEKALLDAMVPFRVMTPQQEIADEAYRSSQSGGSAVRVWDGDTLGGPPRCR